MFKGIEGSRETISFSSTRFYCPFHRVWSAGHYSGVVGESFVQKLARSEIGSDLGTYSGSFADNYRRHLTRSGRSAFRTEQVALAIEAKFKQVFLNGVC
jgi:hypothetical protein